jgi:hypothetical protein
VELQNYNPRPGYFLPGTERAKRKPHFDRQRQRGEDGNTFIGVNNAQGHLLCQGKSICGLTS